MRTGVSPSIAAAEAIKPIVKYYPSFFLGLLLQLISEVNMVRSWTNFVCVEVLRPSQPTGVMSSTARLPNHTLTGQA